MDGGVADSRSMASANRGEVPFRLERNLSPVQYLTSFMEYMV